MFAPLVYVHTCSVHMACLLSQASLHRVHCHLHMLQFSADSHTPLPTYCCYCCCCRIQTCAWSH
jgi:hypothetical protein